MKKIYLLENKIDMDTSKKSYWLYSTVHKLAASHLKIERSFKELYKMQDFTGRRQDKVVPRVDCLLQGHFPLGDSKGRSGIFPH